MLIVTSENLAQLVRGIIGDLNIQCAVHVAENPERPELPCVSFDNIIVWAFPKGGTPDGELIWNADAITVTTFDAPDTSVLTTAHEVYNGGTVLMAVQAGLKLLLSQRLEKAIVKRDLQENPIITLTPAQ